MRQATLSRAPSTPNETCGDWLSDSGFAAKTIERIWLNDAPNISCEKEGEYLCLWQFSKAHGRNLYHLQTTDGRGGIEIHAANVADQLRGCIAIGDSLTQFGKNSIALGMPLKDCWGVTDSVATIYKLEADMRDGENQCPFTLTIKWA